MITAPKTRPQSLSLTFFSMFPLSLPSSTLTPFVPMSIDEKPGTWTRTPTSGIPPPCAGGDVGLVPGGPKPSCFAKMALNSGLCPPPGASTWISVRYAPSTENSRMHCRHRACFPSFVNSSRPPHCVQLMSGTVRRTRGGAQARRRGRHGRHAGAHGSGGTSLQQRKPRW